MRDSASLSATHDQRPAGRFGMPPVSRRSVILSAVALPLAAALPAAARPERDGLVMHEGWVLRADDLRGAAAS